MKNKKFFMGMVGLIGVLSLLTISSIVLGDSFLKKQSKKLIELKVENQVIDAQQTSLIQAKKDLEKYSDLEAVAKQVVPQEKDQARATREIVSLADQAGVKLTSISFPASTLGQAKPKVETPTDGSAAPAAPATPSVTQVKPVDGIKDLFQLDIIVVSDTTTPTSYARLVDFLHRLEQNRRTAQVSQIAIQPNPLDRTSLNFTLTVTVFIKP
ncbi:MAG: hypothetical protein V4702_00085 [Patescibacteria group bacterium]